VFEDLQLGIETDTFDLEGQVVAERPVGGLTDTDIDQCLAGFVGEQMQQPPMFSALKHKGKPLYHYARRGIEVVKEPRKITIDRIDRLDFAGTSLTIRVHCGKGTYIRSLAADIGRILGCGAHLSALRRLRSGPFDVADSVSGTLLAESQQRETIMENLLSIDEILSRLEQR